MFSFTRLAKVGYLFALSFVVFLLASANPSQAQFGVAGGYRGTPALPTIAIPVFSGSGSASAGFGGIAGITGGGGSVSASFNTQIMYLNLGALFPNGGRVIGLPPPPLTPMLSNFAADSLFFFSFPFFPFFTLTSDSTGAPWALLTSMSIVGGMGMSGMGLGGMGMMGMGGGMGMMGMGGGMMGMMMGGLGMMGMGGGIMGLGGGMMGTMMGGLGMMGLGGFGMGGLSMMGIGGFGGFAGKGFGGFNGRKPL